MTDNFWVEVEPLPETLPVKIATRTIVLDFIFGGILDRFPKLKVVCSEFELSWIPYFMAQIDSLQDPYGFGARIGCRHWR